MKKYDQFLYFAFFPSYCRFKNSESEDEGGFNHWNNHSRSSSDSGGFKSWARDDDDWRPEPVPEENCEQCYDDNQFDEEEINRKSRSCSKSSKNSY